MRVKHTWFASELELIQWFKHYATNRSTTKNEKFYKDLIYEIDLGPKSERAVSGELQKGLALIKFLVDEYHRKAYQDILNQKKITSD